MTRRQRRERRGEGGATIVEFGLVGMVVFMFFFGLIDVSLVELGNTAATSAARAGARVAALRPEAAHEETSASYAAVRDAVLSRLAGVVTLDPTFDGDGIDVTCIDGTNGVTERPCNATLSPIVPERDRIRVTVRWRHRGISPFVSSKVKSDSATVTIVGSGEIPVAPTACKVTASTTNTSFPFITSGAGSGTISPSVTVTASTNGLCTSGVTAVVYTGTETATVNGPGGAPVKVPSKILLTTTGGASPNTFAGTFSSSLTWTEGQKTIRFTNGQDYPTEVSYSAVNRTITVLSQTSCAFAAAGARPPTTSPPVVRLASAVSASDPSQTSVLRTGDSIVIWAFGTDACGSQTVLATFTPALPASVQHQTPTTSASATTCGGSTFTFTGRCYEWAISSTTQWNLGLKSFSFDDNNATGTGIKAWPGAFARVQVDEAPPACTISARFYSDSNLSVQHSASNPVIVDEKAHDGLGKLKHPLRIRVTQEFDSSCVGGVYVQWDRGRGFGTAPRACPMTLTSGSPVPPTHDFVIPSSEDVPTSPSAPVSTCTAVSGNPKNWLPTGRVTFQFFRGDPSNPTTQRLTPLTPSSLPILEQQSG